MGNVMMAQEPTNTEPVDAELEHNGEALADATPGPRFCIICLEDVPPDKEMMSCPRCTGIWCLGHYEKMVREKCPQCRIILDKRDGRGIADTRPVDTSVGALAFAAVAFCLLLNPHLAGTGGMLLLNSMANALAEERRAAGRNDRDDLGVRRQRRDPTQSHREC